MLSRSCVPLVLCYQCIRTGQYFGLIYILLGSYDGCSEDHEVGLPKEEESCDTDTAEFLPTLVVD